MIFLLRTCSGELFLDNLNYAPQVYLLRFHRPSGLEALPYLEIVPVVNAIHKDEVPSGKGTALVQHDCSRSSKREDEPKHTQRGCIDTTGHGDGFLPIVFPAQKSLPALRDDQVCANIFQKDAIFPQESQSPVVFRAGCLLCASQRVEKE